MHWSTPSRRNARVERGDERTSIDGWNVDEPTTFVVQSTWNPQSSMLSLVASFEGLQVELWPDAAGGGAGEVTVAGCMPPTWE